MTIKEKTMAKEKDRAAKNFFSDPKIFQSLSIYLYLMEKIG